MSPGQSCLVPTTLLSVLGGAVPIFQRGKPRLTGIKPKNNVVLVQDPLDQTIARPGFPRILFPFTSTLHLDLQGELSHGTQNEESAGFGVRSCFWNRGFVRYWIWNIAGRRGDLIQSHLPPFTDGQAEPTNLAPGWSLLGCWIPTALYLMQQTGRTRIQPVDSGGWESF